MKTGRIAKAIFAALAFLLISSCGLEDYPYINPIPQANITQEFNNRAVVRVPNTYEGTPFSNFAVFYKIYVSDIPVASTTISSFPAINSILSTDYNAFSTYIDSTTIVNTNMENLFQGRGYKYLGLQGVNIGSVLSTAALGNNIIFEFPSSRAPTMTLSGNTYTLWRSDGNGVFSPRPDRLFMNSEELWKSENITSTINADVADKSGIGETARHYTYAALFIVAVGINVSSYSSIFSTPSLIHVFQLPDLR